LRGSIPALIRMLRTVPGATRCPRPASSPAIPVRVLPRPTAPTDHGPSSPSADGPADDARRSSADQPDCDASEARRLASRMNILSQRRRGSNRDNAANTMRSPDGRSGLLT
jgi:hypothetical protein